MMPLPGSNPVDALQRALGLLDSAGVRRGRILLVTDGVNARDAAAMATLLESQTRQLAILGVGTEVGAPIALPGGGFLKDQDGEIVVPALDEAPLEDLAARSNGRYRRMTVDDSDLASLLTDSAIVDDDDTISLDRQADQWQDMAHWFVLPVLLIALGSFRRGWIYLLPLCLGVFPAEKSQALEWRDLWLRPDQQGQQALSAGDAERAAQLFENPAWRGTAAYQGEDYDGAVDAFSGDDSADGWYNRGNALAAKGELKSAIKAYEKSLALKPGQADAEKNLEILKQLKEQQDQEQQQSNSDQQQSNQDGSPDQQNSDAEQQDSQSQNSQNQSGAQDQQSNPGNSQDQQSQDGEAGDGEQNADDEQGSQGDADQSEQQQRRPMPLPEIDNSAMQEDLEKDQAMQQWLRRVPDDPSGLLREKFRYESRQRQQQGNKRDSSKIW
jgi:Ca-activated chloride channel family protein